MGIVFDTNVWVSAVSGHGMVRQLRNLVVWRGDTLYVSPFILEEIDRVLARSYFSWSKRQREELQGYLREVAVVVRPDRMPLAARDLSDNAILACAREAKADVVVTGDKRLRRLGKWKGIRLVTPAELFKELAS